jgi:hypothetical protein
VFFDHSAQGYGNRGGLGVLIDVGGRDTYEGIPGRANDRTIEASSDSTGLFIDIGTSQASSLSTTGIAPHSHRGRSHLRTRHH